MMVIMALVTTALTTPILHWVYPERLFGPQLAAALAGAKRAFSVLIPVSDPNSGAPLLTLASNLAGQQRDNVRLLALHLRKPADHEAYRAGLDEANQTADPTLEPLLVKATEAGLNVEPITLTSTDVSDDIAAVARVRQVNLVLMGFHRPVIGHAILGGTVHRVLNAAPADVGIFVNRGLDGAKRILVPYLGSSHDKLALELAGRLAKATGAQVSVLHIVAPNRALNEKALGAKTAVDRAFAEPGHAAPVQFRVIEDYSPVAAILREAKDYDLVVIGVGEEWGLESQMFGFRPQRIAQDCPTSLLIVRKHQH
jgi:nucleotide-binding universal stress UspA family protein